MTRSSEQGEPAPHDGRIPIGALCTDGSDSALRDSFLVRISRQGVNAQAACVNPEPPGG